MPDPYLDAFAPLDLDRLRQRGLAIAAREIQQAGKARQRTPTIVKSTPPPAPAPKTPEEIEATTKRSIERMALCDQRQREHKRQRSIKIINGRDLFFNE